MDEFGELAPFFARAAADLLSGAPGFHQEATAHSALILSGEPSPALNMLIILSAAEAGQRLAAGAEATRRRGLPLLTLLAPGAAPAETDAGRLGFGRIGTMPLMVLCPETPVAADDRCTIMRATDAAMLEQVAALRAGGRYPLEAMRRVVEPPAGRGIEIFLGLAEGVPVSTVAAVEVGGTVGIWWMATDAARQRQGFGRSLLVQVVGDYRARGAERFYLGASEAGRPLYERLGFEKVGDWGMWMLGAG
ncbi:MAG TPA: GNAT family N-acetyltransferase [Aliidongia sp.]|nr:GNAT family N-acetyltransferase [Aliidongia sp.]